MRKLFGEHLLKFKDLPITHKNHPDNTKAVIIMDDRRDFWTPIVLKNYRYYLDGTWNFHIICTDLNYEWMCEELGKMGWQVNVHHIRDYFPETGIHLNLDLATYIAFYTCPDILKSFKEDIFLTAQLDSMLCSPIKDEYLKWDFIGAPCGEGGTAMNGGCTIRNKNRMIECLEKIPFTGEPDDVYYPRCFRGLGYSIPDVETAIKFSVENWLHQDGVPFGFHGTNKYYIADEVVNELISRIAPIEYKKPRIMIGTPVYKWPPHPKFVESLKRCENDPRFDMEFRCVQGDAHIERARSMLLLQYLEAPTKFDWYVMIDSDIEFNADIIWGIINRGKDVIGAGYAFKAPEGNPKHKQPVIRPLEGQEPIDGLIKVRHLGGGFTVVSDAFLRKMCEEYKDLEFQMNPDLMQGKEGVSTYGLWNPVIIEQPAWGEGKKEMLSEDYSFCERVLMMGGECWWDLSAVIAHWDGETFYQLRLTNENPESSVTADPSPCTCTVSE